MSKLSSIDQLKTVMSDLEVDKVGVTEAIAAVEEILGNRRSWQRTEWRNKRKEIIGSYCVQCGSTKQPLVLQHFFHPRKLSLICMSEATSSTYRQWCEKNPIPEISPDETRYREACPKCLHISLRYRKSDDATICTRCNTVLAETILVPDPHQVAEVKKQHWLRYQEIRRTSVPAKESVYVWIEENVRYLEFRDVATFCKKCAFMWDMKKMRLCTTCGKWTSIYLGDTCNLCKQK